MPFLLEHRRVIASNYLYKIATYYKSTVYIIEFMQLSNIIFSENGRIRLGDFRGALLGHAHMRRSRLCSTKICESNRNCIVFIKVKDDGSDGD